MKTFKMKYMRTLIFLFRAMRQVSMMHVVPIFWYLSIGLHAGSY
jgi:hypothetical protein